MEPDTPNSRSGSFYTFGSSPASFPSRKASVALSGVPHRRHTQFFLQLRDEHCEKLHMDADIIQSRLERISSLDKGSEKSVVLWQDDSSASECAECHSSFNFIRRRHHCRLCGNLFCGKCIVECGTVRLIKSCLKCSSLSKFRYHVSETHEITTLYEKITNLRKTVTDILPKYNYLALEMSSMEFSVESSRHLRTKAVAFHCKAEIESCLSSLESVCRQISEMEVPTLAHKRVNQSIIKSVTDFLEVHVRTMTACEQMLAKKTEMRKIQHPAVAELQKYMETLSIQYSQLHEELEKSRELRQLDTSSILASNLAEIQREMASVELKIQSTQS